jgi:phospho-N-acetylmuramoyl-pentapeptide-transferase
MILSLFTFNIIKILIVSVLSATIGLILGPFLIKVLNKFQFWKKTAREKTITGEKAEVFYSLHKEREIRVPRGGGVLIWSSVLILIFLFFGLSFVQHPWWLKKFNFLSRQETWLPLFTLISGSIVGLIDDILTVYRKGKYIGGGMSFWRRLAIVILIGLIGAWWFYFKLERDTIYVPLIDFPRGIEISIGPWYIPLFVLVMLACWSGGVVDGLDGLSGGVFASIFGAFSIVALSQGRADLATFCATVCGALFAFLWHNIPPAKFYMGETGVLGLTSTLAVVTFLTDSVVVLPIIAGILVIEVGSIILQLLSKKIRKKKIWLSTPIHHHFEARGWPAHQVTMRFWILSMVFAILGLAIRLLS